MGMVIYVMNMTLGEVCGGGYNPARSFAPAIIVGKIDN